MKIIITESQYKLLAEQTTPIKKIEPSLFEKIVTNFLIPVTYPIGTIPVAIYKKYSDAGRKIYNDFASIVNRRLEYNKKNNFPLEKMTPEEIEYRKRILNATPNFGYPNVFDFLKIVDDIQSGKNIHVNNSMSGGQYDQKLLWGDKKKLSTDSRKELKNMWMGLDDQDGLKTGEWIQSKYKPADSANPNAIYYMPKTQPTFTQNEFDLAYNEILKTKKSDGKFPGGNSDIILHSKLPRNIISKFFETNQLGHYKLGASEDGKGKYISFYDEWDLFPPALKNIGVDIQKFGKTPLIYFRIYRP